jgi:hypothetical protein
MDIIVGSLDMIYFGILECWTFELVHFGRISNIGYLKRECSSRQTLVKFLGISSIMSFGVGMGYIRLNSQGETEKDRGPMWDEG